MKFFTQAALSLFVLACTPLHAASFHVRAIAADADGVVLADAAGALRSYARGDALAAAGWRVVGVRDGQIVFEHAATPPLRLHAKVGDEVDFDAIALRARPTPAASLHRVIIPASDR